MQQAVVTPAAGKRLIARGLTAHPAVRSALTDGTVVVVAGTTNGYLAEELLRAVGQDGAFTREGFCRGVVTPPSRARTAAGRLDDDHPFAGDVILVKGQWQQGRQIFDVADDLGSGDVIVKGANAVDLDRREAAVLIGDPQAGTAASAIRGAAGRRVRLLIPVGLEKRVVEPLSDLARMLNAADATGPRLLPLCGDVFTELDAVALLTGAEAHLVASGGVSGAEGASWLAVRGTEEQCRRADELLQSVADEPLCRP
ncbi:MAG: hypothetical protein KGY99_02965 [Phycisphaerae bacterium]|nr:hypothetical protein [Phycisphaerae bacterium]